MKYANKYNQKTQTGLLAHSTSLLAPREIQTITKVKYRSKKKTQKKPTGNEGTKVSNKINRSIRHSHHNLCVHQ